MTNNGWHRTKQRLKYLVLDGMNGLSVVSKFQKIYTMYNKKEGVPEIHRKAYSVF